MLFPFIKQKEIVSILLNYGIEPVYRDNDPGQRLIRLRMYGTTLDISDHDIPEMVLKQHDVSHTVAMSLASMLINKTIRSHYPNLFQDNEHIEVLRSYMDFLQVFTTLLDEGYLAETGIMPKLGYVNVFRVYSGSHSRDFKIHLPIGFVSKELEEFLRKEIEDQLTNMEATRG